MIYSVCSTGATIHLHHCGKSTSLSLDVESKVSHDNCPTCASLHDGHLHETGDSCDLEDSCKDKSIELKSDIEQLQTKNSIQQLLNFSPAIVLIPWIMEQWKSILEDPTQLSLEHLASIPMQDLQPVYLLHCNFRV